MLKELLSKTFARRLKHLTQAYEFGIFIRLLWFKLSVSQINCEHETQSVSSPYHYVPYKLQESIEKFVFRSNLLTTDLCSTWRTSV